MTSLVKVDSGLTRAPTLGNAVIEYIETQTIGIAAKTRRDITLDLGRFVSYVNKKGFTAQSLCAFGTYLQKEFGVISRTVACALSNIKKFLRWCWLMEYTSKPWHEFIPRIKVGPPSDPKIIKYEEYITLRKMCLNPDQDWLIVCGFSTGFRLGDCCNLQWKQIDREMQVVRPLIRKTARSTGRSAMIPYVSGSDMHIKITELESMRSSPSSEDDYVAPSLAHDYYVQNQAIVQGMRRVFNRAGLFDRSFKHFRCTFESRLANSGMNIALATKITGRSDTRSILRYVLPDMEAAREGVAKALELHNTHKGFA